jgi:hypothetical protein
MADGRANCYTAVEFVSEIHSFHLRLGEEKRMRSWGAYAAGIREALTQRSTPSVRKDQVLGSGREQAQQVPREEQHAAEGERRR